MTPLPKVIARITTKRLRMIRSWRQDQAFAQPVFLRMLMPKTRSRIPSQSVIPQPVQHNHPRLASETKRTLATSSQHLPQAAAAALQRFGIWESYRLEWGRRCCSSFSNDTYRFDSALIHKISCYFCPQSRFCHNSNADSVPNRKPGMCGCTSNYQI